MLRKSCAAILILGILFIVGCSTHIHKVGDGAQGKGMIEARQWYVLFGLVPINQVDTAVIAGDATDYEIMTQANVVDIVIGIFTGVVSVSSRTVTVSK